VVRAYDADQINKVLYIVMEYVSGESLSRRLRQGVVAPAEMVGYAAQAALGLGHAHAQGVVHRDVKPSNLLLTEDRKIKVLDLGLGVLMEADEQSTFATADGIAVGTIDYMSPEQACGHDVDGRSDLFSLGCATYHLMAGQLPFPGNTPIERLGKRLSGRPVPISEHLPDLSPNVASIIHKLLSQKPHDRFQTGEEVADALMGLLRPRSRSAPRDTLAPAPSAPPVEPAPTLTPPPPVVVRVEPDYPRWFRPMAALAERRPRTALLAVLGVLAAAVASGFGLAWLLR
jgi:serine/threonine-protein kinase